MLERAIGRGQRIKAHFLGAGGQTGTHTGCGQKRAPAREIETFHHDLSPSLICLSAKTARPM